MSHSPTDTFPRVGWGFDAHALSHHPSDRPIVLGGVLITDSIRVIATSDGDVAAHALTDAVLGVANLADMGVHFPSSDPRWEGADSLELLRNAVMMAGAAGAVVIYADVTVIAQGLRIAPHRDSIRRGLADALGIEIGQVSVKATTTDGLGFIGKDEGLAAVAVVTARSAP